MAAIAPIAALALFGVFLCFRRVLTRSVLGVPVGFAEAGMPSELMLLVDSTKGYASGT